MIEVGERPPDENVIGHGERVACAVEHLHLVQGGDRGAVRVVSNEVLGEGRPRIGVARLQRGSPLKLPAGECRVMV